MTDSERRVAAARALGSLAVATETLARLREDMEGHLISNALDGLASARGYLQTYIRRCEPTTVRIDIDPKYGATIYLSRGGSVDLAIRARTLAEAVAEMRARR